MSHDAGAVSTTAESRSDSADHRIETLCIQDAFQQRTEVRGADFAAGDIGIHAVYDDQFAFRHDYDVVPAGASRRVRPVRHRHLRKVDVLIRNPPLETIEK